MPTATRPAPGRKAHLRFAPTSGRPLIAGYAAVFDSPSFDLGGFKEIIRRGAFSRALRDKADVRALIGHDTKLVLGRTTAGTLSLAEDSRGLRVEISPPDTSYARDLIESIARGDQNGMSFRFYVKAERWSDGSAGQVRELLDVDIDEVTITAFPAYAATSVNVYASADARRRARLDAAVADLGPRTPNRAERLLHLVSID